jgi:hypothetical protein
MENIDYMVERLWDEIFTNLICIMSVDFMEDSKLDLRRNTRIQVDHPIHKYKF